MFSCLCPSIVTHSGHCISLIHPICRVFSSPRTKYPAIPPPQIQTRTPPTSTLQNPNPIPNPKTCPPKSPSPTTQTITGTARTSPPTTTTTTTAHTPQHTPSPPSLRIPRIWVYRPLPRQGSRSVMRFQGQGAGVRNGRMRRSCS